MKWNPIKKPATWPLAAAIVLTASASARSTPAQEQEGAATGITDLGQKLKSIILPQLHFEGATLQEGIDYLGRKSIELDTAENDPQRKGINFVILRSGLPDGPSDEAEHLERRIGRLQLAVAEGEARMLDLARDHQIVDGDEDLNVELYRLARLRLEEERFEVSKLRNLIRARMDCDGDELVRLLASEDRPGVIRSLYREYLQSSRDLVTLEGAARDTATSRQAVLKKQLVEEVAHYRRALGSEMALAEENLASAKASLQETIESLWDSRRRSTAYRAAERDYELKLETLMRLEEAAARKQSEPRPGPATATLQMKNIPLETALRYVTQQLGLSYAVRAHAVLIGSPEEIAALE